MSGLEGFLPPELWKRLVSGAAPRSYAPGQTLMRQGEKADSVLALISGRVTVSLVDEEGRDVLLAVRGGAELIGEMALFGDGTRSATVTAIDRCHAVVLTAAHFERFVRENKLQERLLRHLVHRLQEAERLRAELASLAARPRITQWLIRLAQPPVGRPGPWAGTVEIGIGQGDLIRATGLARSTVAEEITKLKAERAVVNSRTPIVVDPRRLEELL
ncbi:Crp/Fnr family transcriptional regulator [Sphaerisporangium fuscum]|uniref:Crp/Fnr family transcriptional regulator n=1 Tax=Sphaerisporangium fuscum TaxID=2835868 RepID=UPI001BDCCFBB|nr:Crp/Fnr family transcriptional regulator [Sphaerisporangium fuscum]